MEFAPYVNYSRIAEFDVPALPLSPMLPIHTATSHFANVFSHSVQSNGIEISIFRLKVVFMEQQLTIGVQNACNASLHSNLKAFWEHYPKLAIP